MPSPEAEHLPAAPGPGARQWRCRCGNLLGIIDRRWLFTRHRGRVVDASLPARVRCESCGRSRVLRADAPTGAADDRDRPTERAS